MYQRIMSDGQEFTTSGRPVDFCERWDDENAFIADMGPAPDGMDIVRVNGEGDYEPGNCAWAPMDDIEIIERRPEWAEWCRMRAAV